MWLPTLLRLLWGRATGPVQARPPEGFPVAQGRVLLALDFDGVLHQAQSGTLDRLGLLQGWLRTQPCVDVVISSSWREFLSLEDLRALFAQDLRARIVGVTPVLDGRPREAEIQAFAGKVPWVALDDDASGFPTRLHQLVQTEYLEALGENHLVEAQRRLHGQLSD